MKLAFVVPAYQVAPRVAEVVRSLLALGEPLARAGSELVAVVIVDDGSNDQTAALAATAGGRVVRHVHNLGKGAALVSGFRAALALGAEAVVTVDGDGQHPAGEVLKVALCPAPANALVLGVRNMRTVGAPRLHQFSNAISNFFLGFFMRRRFRDSQCGLRRYPALETLALRVRSGRYAFEAEVLLRAWHQGWSFAEEPIVAYYPPREARISHYRVAVDSFRIIVAVVSTLFGWHFTEPDEPRVTR